MSLDQCTGIKVVMHVCTSSRQGEIKTVQLRVHSLGSLFSTSLDTSGRCSLGRKAGSWKPPGGKKALSNEQGPIARERSLPHRTLAHLEPELVAPVARLACACVRPRPLAFTGARPWLTEHAILMSLCRAFACCGTGES